MPPLDAAPRKFRVHARHLETHHARIVEEPSFEAAALAYIEDFTPSEAVEVRIIVRDMDSGHEHCFLIDLETGDASACG